MAIPTKTMTNVTAVMLNDPKHVPPSAGVEDKLRKLIAQLDVVYDAYDKATDEWRAALDAEENARAEKLRSKLAVLTGVLIGLNRQIIDVIDSDEADEAMEAIKRILALAEEIKASSGKTKRFLDAIDALAGEIKGLFDIINK